MAEQKMIVMDVSDSGEVKLETRGYRGKGCTEDKAVKILKELLGKEISRQLTPAYALEDGVRVTKHLPLCG